MIKKLSEIKEDAVLIVEETVLTKEDILRDLEYYKNKNIYTTTEYKANINAMDMLESAIEYEHQNMYYGWDEEVLKDVTNEDLKELQVILDRLLNRSSNIAYFEDKKVEVDIKTSIVDNLKLKYRHKEGFLEIARNNRENNKEFFDAWGNE